MLRVGLGRFELPTSRLSGVRSNQLSYRPRTTDFYGKIKPLGIKIQQVAELMTSETTK